MRSVMSPHFRSHHRPTILCYLLGDEPPAAGGLGESEHQQNVAAEVGRLGETEGRAAVRDDGTVPVEPSSPIVCWRYPS